MMIDALRYPQLWHLTPCFHIPSFLADFSRQRDTYDTDFLAVVMALSTFTLVGIPKAWLPFEKAEIYGKVWDCIEGTQAILFTLQNYPPTLSTSMYLGHGYHSALTKCCLPHSRGSLPDRLRLSQPGYGWAFNVTWRPDYPRIYVSSLV